ncbi:TrmB family transcriptional regulator [Aeromicrobium wangtongii]|uniref:TrmB family transcriptional regulator n=1 Tax=Aeromicrobium wangtongii TaxID=2969247 RepID=UPI0020176ED9|nr:helix-turn-helix domain-containing protein [Aeromicrobium wangtongii]MCL3816930.1 hypothetical protein [Aeromicrobium wangtongii]
MSHPSPSAAPADVLASSLQDLGFSSYEARCYVGLLGQPSQTGYAVSKRTGVPQPKVYEALRKLVARGAAFEVDVDPVLFAAVPPKQLLDGLSSHFQERHRGAREAAERLDIDTTVAPVAAVYALDSASSSIAAGTAAISRASRRVYTSASPDEMAQLLPALEERRDAGVDVVLIDFARKPVPADGMRVFRHASTENSIYRHHQARHIAVVVDSVETVYAVAPGGDNWDGVRTRNAAVIAAVKGMIKHDIDLQQIYADFGPALVEAYGPGLQALEKYRQDDTSERTAGDPGSAVQDTSLMG